MSMTVLVKGLMDGMPFCLGAMAGIEKERGDPLLVGVYSYCQDGPRPSLSPALVILKKHSKSVFRNTVIVFELHVRPRPRASMMKRTSMSPATKCVTPMKICDSSQYPGHSNAALQHLCSQLPHS